MNERRISWKRLSLLFTDKTPRDIQWRWSAMTHTPAVASFPEPPPTDEPTAPQENDPQQTVVARNDDSGTGDFGDTFWFSLVDEEPSIFDF
jgi:hypothetical protein